MRSLGLGDSGVHGTDSGRTRGAGDADSPEKPDPRRAVQGTQLNTLSSGVAALRVQLRDMERSLVDRIADVDDDRRLALGQLQRAMQTQKDECSARLRLQGWLTIVALLLLTACAATGIYLLYQRISEISPHPTRTQELSRMIDEQSVIAHQQALLQERFTALATRVAALAEAQVRESAVQSQPPQPNREANTSKLAQIGRLQMEQERLRSELKTLRTRLAAVPTAPPPQNGEQVHSEGTAVTEPRTDMPTDPATLDTGTTAEIEEKPPTQSPDETETQIKPTSARPSPSEAPDTPGTDWPGADPQDPPTLSAGDRPFALQLIGYFDRASLLDLAARADLPRQVYSLEESLRGRPWYVMIHSLHVSYEDAQNELAALPPELLALEPWIRKMPPETRFQIITSGPTP